MDKELLAIIGVPVIIAAAALALAVHADNEWKEFSEAHN